MMHRSTIGAYGAAVQRFVKELLEILSLSLGLPSKQLETAFGGDDAQVILRVNHYPRCPQVDRVLGLSPHSDGSAITVLLDDDNVQGLQVKKDGTWWAVKAAPGALLVNMGDMMQVRGLNQISCA
jgi:flavonol synthase